VTRDIVGSVTNNIRSVSVGLFCNGVSSKPYFNGVSSKPYFNGVSSKPYFNGVSFKPYFNDTTAQTPIQTGSFARFARAPSGKYPVASQAAHGGAQAPPDVEQLPNVQPVAALPLLAPAANDLSHFTDVVT
jgi:hypothetical protein